MPEEQAQFAVSEDSPGELERYTKFVFHTHHAALLESLRHGKIWPDVRLALREAGLEIVPIEQLKH